MTLQRRDVGINIPGEVGSYVFEEATVEKIERATCSGGGHVTMVLSDPQSVDVQWIRKWAEVQRHAWTVMS